MKTYPIRATNRRSIIDFNVIADNRFTAYETALKKAEILLGGEPESLTINYQEKPAYICGYDYENEKEI